MDINGIRSRGTLTENLKFWYPFDWSFLYNKQTGIFQCAYCGLLISKKDLTEDHIYPRSLCSIRLVTSACENCNNKKGSKLPIEWAIFAYENNIDIGADDRDSKNPSKVKRVKKKELSPNTNTSRSK